MRLSDRVSGAALVALGGLAAWGGSRLPAVPGQDVGPAVFPMLIGFGLIACGLMIALGVGHAFEAPEEEGGGRSWWHGLWALLPPALLVLYMLLAERIGFLLMAAAMVLVVALAFGARLRLALPLAVLAPLAVHLVFYRLLRVPLPEGLLAAPW
ncbi:tripartite tricarboxylate transporter TctB family protein [Crenalkalicoccus roseus]|uniref:tripartite tricarboxylate transporter TctB family protein n=1 Tax=Crenalkalicoccus roseus TaxID=1485588 RepID=UPI001082015A|nr:tripartite tricarboxylate transporter TctB family protein [Crenalkalicoccus roseus]